MNTQKEIADALGLSMMTVSRCLNRSGSVSAKTRERIFEYVRKCGYRPNLMAQSLQRKHSNIIGLVVPTFTYSFYPEIIESIRKTLGREYNLILALSEDRPDEERNVLEMLAGIPVDGILFSPSDSVASMDNCRYLEDSGIPFVMFDRYFSEVEQWSFVATDCFSGSVRLVEYLHQFGHTRIAHIGGNEGSFSRQMFEGYRQGLDNCGLPFEPELVLRGAVNEEAGAAAMEKLIQSGKKFTAVHAASDPLAIGVLKKCKENGIRVPADLSITGFSDIKIAQMLSVPLTTIRESTAEIGEKSVRLLLKRIQNGKASQPEHILLSGTFMERKSVGKASPARNFSYQKEECTPKE